jgi:hypothetical protein
MCVRERELDLEGAKAAKNRLQVCIAGRIFDSPRRCRMKIDRQKDGHRCPMRNQIFRMCICRRSWQRHFSLHCGAAGSLAELRATVAVRRRHRHRHALHSVAARLGAEVRLVISATLHGSKRRRSQHQQHEYERRALEETLHCP